MSPGPVWELASSPGPLSISQLLMLPLFACNIKSWEIERGPGDEAMWEPRFARNTSGMNGERAINDPVPFLLII